MHIKHILLTIALVASASLQATRLNPGIHYLSNVAQRTDNVERAFNDIIKNNACVLVDFYAEWCSPCKRLGAILPNVAQAFPGLVILKIDIDGPQCSKITGRFSVSSIPAILCFKNGSMVQRINGFNGQSALINTLNRIF